MGYYVFRRVLLALPTLIVASLLVFMILRLVPGDPALLVVGDVQDSARLAEARQKLGLDQPIWVQYGRWFLAILSGDFGQSIVNGVPVLPLLLERFAVTAQLVLSAMVLATLVGVPAGMLAARCHRTRIDLFLSSAAILLMSVPSFWVALLLILAFGVELAWLPTVGYVSPFVNPVEGLRFLCLPVLSLAFVVMGQIARLMRASTLEELDQDYVTHARAKGVDERRILTRHVLRNAFAPTMTLIGLLTGTLLGGAAVIETLFTLPGLGRLLVDSVYARDYPVIQGVVLLVGVSFVGINLLVDLLYPLLDPRVRL